MKPWEQVNRVRDERLRRMTGDVAGEVPIIVETFPSKSQVKVSIAHDGEGSNDLA